MKYISFSQSMEALRGSVMNDDSDIKSIDFDYIKRTGKVKKKDLILSKRSPKAYLFITTYLKRCNTVKDNS